MQVVAYGVGGLLLLAALPRGAVPRGGRLLGARGRAAAHPALRPGGPGAGPGGAPHPPGQPAAPGLAGAAAALPLLVGPQRADRRLRGALHPVRGPAGRLPAGRDGRGDAGRRHRGGPVRPAPRAGPAGQPAAVPAGRPVPGLLVAAVDLGGDGARAWWPRSGTPTASRCRSGWSPTRRPTPSGRRSASGPPGSGRVRRSARCWPAPRPTCWASGPRRPATRWRSWRPPRCWSAWRWCRGCGAPGRRRVRRYSDASASLRVCEGRITCDALSASGR